MIPIREGFTLNLSFLKISDIIVLVIVLLLSSFNLFSDKKVKNGWVRAGLYLLVGIVLIFIGRFLLPEGIFLTQPLGNLDVHWYGVLIMTGAVFATLLAAWGAKYKKIDPNMVWDVLPWALIAGIIGARIWHILTPPESMIAMGITTKYYLTHPLDAIAIWNGGLGIPGAVIGGAFALYVYCRIKKFKFGDWADIVAPGVALAQAVGRIGNFLNQELYGKPSSLPWAIFVDESHRLPGFMEYSTYHPLFAYEAIWNLLNMAILIWLGIRFAKKLISGDIFLIYLMFYAVGRFSLEFLRLDYSPVGGVNVNQTLMAIVFIIALALIIIRHVIGKQSRKKLLSESKPATPTAKKLVTGKPSSSKASIKSKTPLSENTATLTKKSAKK
jgi:phosphatidylglycerol:prolipoprotein diacylglycerol transferase